MKFSFIFLCEMCTTNNLSISRAMSGKVCQEVMTHPAIFLTFSYNREMACLWKKEVLHVIQAGANSCQNLGQTQQKQNTTAASQQW